MRMFGYMSERSSNNVVTRENDSERSSPQRRDSESAPTTEATSLLSRQNPVEDYSTQDIEANDAEIPFPEIHEDQDIQEDQDNNLNANIPRRGEEEDIAQQITTLTNRLRVLFYTLYIPIIPLSALLLILLSQLLYHAAISPPCSYPLRFFAFLSLILFLYMPNHKAVKRWLFNYSRERDGNMRPRNVRIFDQCIHMVCLMYLYLDMVLVESCKEDVVDNISTCLTTCPELYGWFEKFDLVLRIFSAILLLPLICLPFIYVWIMRRINAADALRRFDIGFNREQEGDFLAGGVKVKEIMENLREVHLIESKEDENQFKVVGKGRLKSWSGDKLRDKESCKDCCICMTEFYFGINESDLHQITPSQDCIVETKCGHLFHKACIGGWVGGRDWEDASSMGRARARRRCCPLCREDLAIPGNDSA